MRNMSFSMTTDQILDRSKTVTRRMGWRFLKPGDRVRAVKKAMGLKKGEKVEELAILEIVSVRREPLSALTDNLEYGREECCREGFGDHRHLSIPAMFFYWFCRTHKCDVDVIVTRIEFRYVEDNS